MDTFSFGGVDIRKLNPELSIITGNRVIQLSSMDSEKSEIDYSKNIKEDEAKSSETGPKVDGESDNQTHTTKVDKMKLEKLDSGMSKSWSVASKEKVEVKTENPSSSTDEYCSGTLIPGLPVFEKRARGTGRRVIACPQCPYSTVKSAHLRRHIMSVHRGAKPFHCPQCNYCTSEKGNLKKHISNVHLGNKPFECPQCDYCTSWKKDLHRHIMSLHTHLKPFKCSQCDYSSSNSEHLKSHIMSVHLKTKPYECTYCNFCTSWKSVLRKHIRKIHSGTKPLQCPSCDYNTLHKAKLVKHMVDKQHFEVVDGDADSVHHPLSMHCCEVQLTE